VSISADGTRVAIGGIYNDGNGNGSNSGHVRVYEIPPTGSTGANNTPVTVNLNVEVSASGNINIFGQEELAAPLNVIVANTTLPIAGLYDAAGVSNSEAENSMFEFWEDSALSGARAATLAVSNGRNYKKLTRKLAGDIQACLEGEFDVSAASPFNASKYDGVAEYRVTNNFGELALHSFSHYMLGHIDATAAITNDQAFVHAMLSQDAQGAYKGAGTLYAEDDMTGVAAGTNADANLAKLLVQAIVGKNGAAVLAIVEQVLGQDASRAMDQDNNTASPDVRHALKFIAGDIIYMNIKLLKPDVILQSGQKVLDSTLENKYATEENYTIKFTLA
jgi:hypothetical protein